jgi:hypothetical protein
MFCDGSFQPLHVSEGVARALFFLSFDYVRRFGVRRAVISITRR